MAADCKSAALRSYGGSNPPLCTSFLYGSDGSDVKGDEEVDFARDFGRASGFGMGYDRAGQDSAGGVGFGWKFCAADRAHGVRFAIR